jgi:circadian clock protein KaiB
MSRQNESFVFLLFVADHEMETARMCHRFTAALDEHIAGEYRLEVVDILQAPERAEAERVFATPMLVKKLPTPSIRILGDLNDPKRLLRLLGIPHP